MKRVGSNNNNDVRSDTSASGRVIDGVLYPNQECDIDERGYTMTKHAIRFRGADWDVVLTEQRDELSKRMINEAAEATGEPKENIAKLRFVVNSSHLHAKFYVRHRASISLRDIQQKLAGCKWRSVKAMYKPRACNIRMRNPLAVEDSSSCRLRRPHNMPNVSFFGRINCGPTGPEFVDDAVDDQPTIKEEEMDLPQLHAMRQAEVTRMDYANGLVHPRQL